MIKYLIIFFGILFSQGLDVNMDFYDRVKIEINSISDQKISNNLFIWPTREVAKNSYYNFFGNQYDNISINPVLGIRLGNNGLEINDDIPFPIIWITPGINFNFNQILIKSFNPIWINGWFRFHKHSAYSLSTLELAMEGGNSMGSGEYETMFLYNPDYEYGFYMPTKFPKGNGIDFDESVGAFSILGNNFDITFGNLRVSLGPSFYSNLSLSHTIPSFNQMRAHYNFKDKIYFTFIIGDLYSAISVDSLDNYYDENRYPILPRRVYNHRIDFNLFKNMRLGFYEQIIHLSQNSSFSYINPFNFYWSEQHEGGDLDNLQMGIDFDLILGKNRIYGGLLIDEWAPYDTFAGDDDGDGVDDSRNWFAKQIGLSRLLNIYDKKALLKFEISSAEPQVYTHKFKINDAYHHNYPIGLWSGGDSIDKRLNFILFLDQMIIDIGYQNTKIGEPMYEQGISLLSGENIKVRDLLYIQIQKPIYFNIDFNFKVGYYKTENLYSEDNFLDISTSLIYNIQK